MEVIIMTVVETLFDIFIECLITLGWAFGFAVVGIICGYIGIIGLIKLEEEANKTKIVKETISYNRRR